MAAAYFDQETTGKLAAAIKRGEAPPSTASRKFNGRHVPVWSRAECDGFIQRRHDLVSPPAHSNDNFNPMEFV
jgi:hypothetical protein